jgi:hypothetical protein
MTDDIVIVHVVSVCIDMPFLRWSLRPKHVKDERLKRESTSLIVFYRDNITFLLFSVIAVLGEVETTQWHQHRDSNRYYPISCIAL